jgi:hypothetical protein
MEFGLLHCTLRTGAKRWGAKRGRSFQLAAPILSPEWGSYGRVLNRYGLWCECGGTDRFAEIARASNARNGSSAWTVNGPFGDSFVDVELMDRAGVREGDVQ